MEEIIDYNELFKAKFDDERLNKLIALSEDEESEHEFNNEELAELLRLEGRGRMENIKLAEELQREIDELERKRIIKEKRDKLTESR